jgi:hypothetical protein
MNDEDGDVLDAEAARSGRSISALIRDAIAQTHGVRAAGEDVRAIDAALGAWTDRVVDGEAYVDGIRSGDRLRPAMTR